MSISTLPAECLLNIFSFNPDQDIPKTSMVCNQWNLIVTQVFWDRVFVQTRNLVNPEPILNKAVRKLEYYFSNDTKNHKKKIKYFFQSCSKKDVIDQVNLINNLCHTIRKLDQGESKPRFEKFVFDLFYHSKSTTPIKLSLLEYCKRMEIETFKKLNVQGKPLTYSVVPQQYRPFEMVTPKKKVVEMLQLLDGNKFVPGELVVVIDNGNLPLGEFSLYYGRITSTEPLKIALKTLKDGSCLNTCQRSEKEVVKFPQKIKLPSFCL